MFAARVKRRARSQTRGTLEKTAHLCRRFAPALPQGRLSADIIDEIASILIANFSQEQPAAAQEISSSAMPAASTAAGDAPSIAATVATTDAASAFENLAGQSRCLRKSVPCFLLGTKEDHVRLLGREIGRRGNNREGSQLFRRNQTQVPAIGGDAPHPGTKQLSRAAVPLIVSCDASKAPIDAPAASRKGASPYELACKH